LTGIGAGRDRLVTARVYKNDPVMFDEMSHMLMLMPEPRWREVPDEIIRFVISLPG
jgi:hypothetical protein